MKIHEYHGKELLRKFGIAVPRGIPAFSVDAGQEVVGKPACYGKAKSDEYREKHYHQPSDEIQPDWDWGTSKELSQLGYWLGWEAANSPSMPNWKPGDEFRGVRDASLAARK